MRAEVQRLVGAAPKPETGDGDAYTPRVKRVLALAANEAKALHHTYVGTEHNSFDLCPSLCSIQAGL